MHTDSGFTVRIDYIDGLYSGEQIRSFVRMFENVAASFLTADKLKDIKLVGDLDEAFLAEINNTGFEYDRSESIWDNLGKVIAKHGEKTVVCYKNRTITYAELDVLTAGVASFFKSKGLGREDFVSVLIP